MRNLNQPYFRLLFNEYKNYDGNYEDSITRRNEINRKAPFADKKLTIGVFDNWYGIEGSLFWFYQEQGAESNYWSPV